MRFRPKKSLSWRKRRPGFARREYWPRQQRSSLMLKIAFGSLDQIRDEVVAPFELNINLRVGVLVAIAQCDQRIVSADNEHKHEDPDQNDSANEQQANYHRQIPSSSFIARPWQQRRQS